MFKTFIKLEKKTGIYICTGCEIGNCLDINSLKNIVTEEFKPVSINIHPSLCSAEGVDAIKQDIDANKNDNVIIAACSPRVNTDKFNFDGNTIIERVNLREQVAWCSIPGDEDTQLLAEDYIRMAFTKINSISKPAPYIPENIVSDILVVGGGITGITSAIEGAKAGYKVTLLEKEDKLGGWSNNLYKQLPIAPPYNKPAKPVIDDIIDELKNYSNIEVITSAEIQKITGQPGEFVIEVKKGSTNKTINVGAIVTAQGWKPYDANKLSELGYSKIKDIITNVEFEKLAKEGKIIKPSDGKKPKSVLFVQCAGSRDDKHLPYCSSYCCGTTLKQAAYIREFSKDTSVFVIYKDIRTPGQYENFYREIQNDELLFLTKGEIKEITQKNGSLITVIAKNTLLNEEISIDVEMVVLATGMTPESSDVLNLDYRLGKGLPELKYNFSDSHFICFPYETRRTGIYAAGSARAPMDISACRDDAAGAMLRAIQCVEATSRGEAVHPRSGDTSYPELFLDRCTDCKRCTEECPFGMYDENEKGTPLPNPSRCRRCGICLGACPERVINFKDYSINSTSAMIKSVSMPDEFEEKPRVLVFVCENDAYPALDMAGFKRHRISPYVRIIPVRCLGSVNKVWISDALSKGYDGILQIGCKPGDDYQCHFIHGSELTKTRGENVQETLTTMMLETERIKTEFVEINDFDKIPEIINDYMEVIEDIGPNPFKDL